MAEIALRTYIKEIDESIEQEQLDQAIAHSRHILETYPKHLDTYRLLGKAYLEAKRYGDAADLFQRVLSAVPDDFVAHVGMSIVREDEGNLDASIWHMERAFETNPANPTIQQELRRLIGRRDGMEPHKVRLTRGALARMYAHGELYQQAVAELRSALVEDPERPDLQVLLANLYWRMNQRPEAVGVGKSILEKLPFCRDANRILAASLQGADKIEEAASYHRRLAALDPYAAFVESAMVDPSTVDPASVRLEKLAWSPGQALTPLAQGRPVWATSLGEELKSQQAAGPPVNLPSWLESQPSPEPAPIPAPRAPSEAVHPFAAAKAPPEAPIPEWMEDAGWYPSKGEAVDGPVEFSESELGGPSQDVEPAQPLAAAEMPGWLNEISPPSQPEQAQGGGAPNWMDDIPAAGVAAGAAIATARREQEPEPKPAAEEPAADALESAELPTWLDDMAPGASETIVYWLGDRDKTGGGDAAPPDLEAPGVPEGAPDWLQEAATEEMEFEPAAPASEAQPADDLPAWLSGVARAAEQEPEPAEAAEMPSWSDEAPEGPSLAEFEAEGAPTSAPAEEAPDWLRSILDTGAEPEAADEPLEPAAGEAWGSVTESAWLEPETGAGQLEEAPDWLARLTSPEQDTEAAQEVLPPAAETPVSAVAAAASVDWLRGLLDTSEEAPTPGEGEAEPEAWLRGLAAPEIEEPEVVAEATSTEAGSDDWLRSMVAEPSELAEEPPSFELEQPEWLERLVAPDSREQSGTSLEAPDWVKALAAMEPGPEAEPATEADEPAEPEWLGRVLGAEAQPAVEAIEAEDELEEPPPWLARPAEPGLATGVPGAQGAFPEEELLPLGRLPAASPPETPNWLREFADAAADKTPAPPTHPPAPAPPPPDIEYEGALDWLREGETGPIGPEEVGLVAPAVASGANTPAGSVDDDEIFRWLDDLAQRQPEDAVPSGIIPRAELVPKDPAAPSAPRAPIPEEAEAGMEWLEQLAGDLEPAPALPEPPPMVFPEETPAAVPVQPAPVEEVIAVEPTPPMPPQPQRPEPEEEDITVWLKSLSMAPAQPAAPPTLAAAPPPSPAPAVVPPPPSAPAPVVAGPVQPIPEEPPKKPTWTPVDESWLQPAAPPVQAQPPVSVPPAAPPPAVLEPPVVLPPAPPAQAEPVVKPRAKAAGTPEVLVRARQHLSQGDLAKASKDYSTVIKKKYELDTVISDLRMAADHFPAEAGLWQLLGDAYMRADRLDEAVEAYNRGIQAA